MSSRLKKVMLIVLVIQVILFGIAIFSGNTIQELSSGYLSILDNRVSLRRDYLEDQMRKYWSNLQEFEKNIQKEASKLGLLDDSSLIANLLENVLDQTIFTLRQSGVTEIFIILEGENDHEGIYLRDLDPRFNNVDNSDILMERGSIDIAQKLGMTLDSYWSNKFKLREGEIESEFYYKPFRAVEDNPNKDINDLGYWSRPFRLSPYDVEIITYSIPLVDKDGNAYGVMGVGLTTDYLSRKLNYDELAKKKQGSYLLSINNKKTNSFEEILISGPMYNIFNLSKASFNEKKVYENIYEIKTDEDTNKNIYASEKHLNIYNDNTPFEDDLWSLTGFVDKKELFGPINKIMKSVIVSLIISLIIGIRVAYMAGNWYMKPVNSLMKRILESNPDKPFKQVKTNIKEIDELSYAIESLNNEIFDYEFKLSNIINMMNVPIGAFEYVPGEEKSFCTNTLFEIIGIENKESSNYVRSSYLKKIIDDVKDHPEKDSPNIYRYEKEDGKICWVRLIIEDYKFKKLGIIEDLTDEILLKHKIEYERDHDVLTHLFNRRAFEVMVRKKMEKGILGNAAFVMWDLDNLKYINDTYGHEYGDRYIQKAASILNKVTVENAIVARMSGDEFYTFIYDYENKDEIRNIVECIKENLYNSYLKVPDGEIIRIRASAGVSWYPDDSRNYEELIRYSDFAMYEVKNTDKGNILEFSEKAYNQDSILLYGKEELNHFIDQELVDYAFQPIVDAKTGEIFGYEALMRPKTKNLKSPFDVMRLAQSQSKLYEIERLTLFQSMRSYKDKKKYFKGAKIFINSIPSYSLSKKDIKLFEEEFTCHLDKLVFEVTEGERSDESCTKIKQEMIGKWGGDLALDDFGSGYNSELTLLMLSPKYVKIDMNIVRGIDMDLNRQKLLQNILSYSKNRNIKIIAEGVETKEEMDKLIEFEVDYIQGYYLGKPNLIPQKLDPKIKREIRGK